MPRDDAVEWLLIPPHAEARPLPAWVAEPRRPTRRRRGALLRALGSAGFAAGTLLLLALFHILLGA